MKLARRKAVRADRPGFRLLALLVYAAGGLTLAGCEGSPQRAERVDSYRGILLISLDTLRSDHLGIYGYARDTSPFLDSVASTGTVFENAFAPIHGTLPSHMTMLTGLQPWNHGVYPPSGVLPPETPQLQEILQQAGFSTAGFTEGGYVDGTYGFSRGFDHFSDEAKKIETDVERTFERARGFLAELEADERFFLFLHTYAIHDPYYPSGEFAAGFPPEVLPPAELNELFGPTIPEHVPFPTGPALADYNAGKFSLDADELAAFVAAYDRSIRYVDQQLERLFAFLEEKGLDRDLLIVITSDHGEEFAEHGRLAHTQIYRETVQVPLIVIGDRVPAQRIGTPVGLVDVTPTLLDFAGLSQPDTQRDGQSLAPRITQTAEGGADRGFVQIEQLDQTKRSVVEATDDRRLLQLLESSETGADWHSESMQFRSASPAFEVQIRSYHRDREITVSHGERQLLAETVPAAQWKTLQIAVGETDAPRTFTVATEGCDIPAEVSDSRDRRCLSFQLRTDARWTSELFDLSNDPAGSIDLSVTLNEQARSMRRHLRWQRSLAPSTELAPELEERLKALGYLQ